MTRRPARAFSMLELVIALAVVALAAGLISGALGAWGATARQRSTVDTIVRALSLARLDAMRAQQPVEARLEPSEKPAELTLRIADKVNPVRAAGLAPVPGLNETDLNAPIRRSALGAIPVDDLANTGRASELRVKFDSSGRADSRAWRLAALDGAGANASPGRTLWIIRFDAVSGAVSAQRADTPATLNAPANAGVRP